MTDKFVRDHPDADSGTKSAEYLDLLDRHGIKRESVVGERLVIRQGANHIVVHGTIDIIGVHPEGTRLPNASADSVPRTRIHIDEPYRTAG